MLTIRSRTKRSETMLNTIFYINTRKRLNKTQYIENKTHKNDLVEHNHADHADHADPILLIWFFLQDHTWLNSQLKLIIKSRKINIDKVNYVFGSIIQLFRYHCRS